MEDDSKNRTREVAETILGKVVAVIAAVKDAKRANEVVCALHSLVVRLFPLDSHALSGSIDQQYRDQVLSAKVPSEQERTDWWRVFYQGAAFPTLARVLLYVGTIYNFGILGAEVQNQTQLAVTCLELHAEMALQASRALEFKVEPIDMPSNLLKGTIKIPH